MGQFDLFCCKMCLRPLDRYKRSTPSGEYGAGNRNIPCHSLALVVSESEMDRNCHWNLCTTFKFRGST